MAAAALGYSAVTAMLDCYLDPAAFADLPVVPSDFSVHVMEAKLRSPVAGVLKSINEERWLFRLNTPSLSPGPFPRYSEPIFD